MLVPIVFIVAFMLALTGALLETSLHAAKIALHRSVARDSDVALGDGVADFSHGLATFVAAHGTSGPWPRAASRSALKSPCDAATSCPFRYVVSAEITAASGDGGSTGSDAAPNLQASVINEQRVSAIVSVAILGPTGRELGSRTRLLTYRVFETAPYAVISGSRDLSSIEGRQAAAQGDSGGTAGGGATGGAESSDTRIHVRLLCRTVDANVVPFVNDQQPAGNDSLPWGNAAAKAYEAPCASPDAPGDAFRDETWVNGDANASGWTR